MRGTEFLERLRSLATRRGIEFRFDAERGKGSHGRIRFGVRMSHMPDPRRELKRGTLSGICRDLGIKPDDLYGI
jgi:hypothetical protein